MLPPTFELAKKYKVANQTAQNALKELSLSGEIVRVPGQGSYISDNKTVALVVGRSLLSEPDTLFYSKLTIDAATYLKSKGWNTKIYTPSIQTDEGKMVQELDADVRLGKIKFVLIISSSSQISPWLKECKVPWSIAMGQDTATESLDEIINIGIPYLADLGYRRIGVLFSNFSNHKKHIEATIGRVTATIHPLPEITFFMAKTNYPEDGMNVILNQLDVQNHPEALLVLDDNLCRGAIVGLLAKHLNFPEKIGLVTHANAGVEILSPVPLCKIMFSSSRVLHYNIDKMINSNLKEPNVPFHAGKIIEGLSCNRPQIKE